MLHMGKWNYSCTQLLLWSVVGPTGQDVPASGVWSAATVKFLLSLSITKCRTQSQGWLLLQLCKVWDPVLLLNTYLKQVYVRERGICVGISLLGTACHEIALMVAHSITV